MDVLEGLLEGEGDGGREQDGLVCGRRALVAQLLGLRDVDVHVAFLGVLAHDHALVALVAGLDEHRAALLQGVERVGHGLVRCHSDHDTVLAADDLAADGAVLAEAVREDGLAVRDVEDLGAQTHDAAGGDLEAQGGAVSVGAHVDHGAAVEAEDLDDLASVLAGGLHRSVLDRLHVDAVDLLEEDLGAAHLELEALAAHGLHQDGEVQDAATGNFDAAFVLELCDAHGDVGLALLEQALLELAGTHDVALPAHERARGCLEDDGQGGFLDLDGLHLDGVLDVCHHVSDVCIVHAGDGDDVARKGLLRLLAAQGLEGVELLDDRLVALVAAVLDDEHLVSRGDLAAVEAAGADAADVLAVVDRADLHGDGALGVDLRGGDVLENRVEQGEHVHVAVIGLEAGVAVDRRGVDDGEVELLVCCAELHHELEDLVDHLVRAGAGAVDLVDDDQGAEAAGEGVLEHEAGLGHGALEGVDQQQAAVRHLEDALDLAAEIRMARGVDHVDLDALVANGDVLGEDGDAALALLIVRVQHALCHLLVLAEDASLLEQLVDHGCLAVVDVGDDGDVA